MYDTISSYTDIYVIYLGKLESTNLRILEYVFYEQSTKNLDPWIEVLSPCSQCSNCHDDMRLGLKLYFSLDISMILFE